MSNYETKVQQNITTIQEIGAKYFCSSFVSLVMNYPKFLECSGSSSPNKHHYGTGGLVEHTAEVITLCDTVAEKLGYNSDFKQELFLAALYHDIGKVYDYEYTSDGWIATSHKYKIHHISKSAQIWIEHSNTLNFWWVRDIRDRVLHAILAHHGRKEAGSPVTPLTKLAWMLHLCDGLSARCNDTVEIK